MTIRVTAGAIALQAANAIELLYPFERVGRFESDDAFLNRLWTLCARSLELMSEDAYTDCADRERVEWMDNTPPAFEVTRVAMATPDGKGGMRYADPRLVRELLRRISLTAMPDGQMKAHSCSERWDVHAIMEDRSCDWVIVLRQYLEATGNTAFVRTMWPALVGLMAWFRGRRTPRGLVLGREWEVWGNPLCYQVCEGAGLNAFLHHALVDAAYIGRQIGRTAQARVFADHAAELSAAFNAHLWDEGQGTYSGALFGPGSKRATGMGMTITDAEIAGGRFRPTLPAALFALDAGLVPPDRHARLVDWMLRHQDEIKGVMTHHFLFKALYALDRADLDTQVLTRMRSSWKAMVDSDWGTSWEALVDAGASKVHLYGIVPGYFLSAYVLGVRPDGPIAARKLLIDPRPGDLKRAEGVVVTEFGPVPIRWTRAATGAMDLSVTVPDGVTCTLRLPAVAGLAVVDVDKHPITGRIEQDRVSLPIGSGEHRVRQHAAAHSHSIVPGGFDV